MDAEHHDKWTLVQIQKMTGYGTTATTYQALRRKDVQPVSYRPNPSGQGGDIGEYDPREVLAALGRRISMHELKSRAQK